MKSIEVIPSYCNKLDLLKVFAILLVVVGHVTNHYETHWTKLVTFVIYIFHMPLFIAVSGAVFKIGCNKGKYMVFLPFIENKFKRLLIPFFSTAMIVMAPTLVLCGESSMSYCGTVADILRGGTCVKHLWFLMALFWMFVIVWGIMRARINLGVAFIVSIAVSIAFKYVNMPYGDFGFSAAVTRFPMFMLGMILCNCKKMGWGAICVNIVICVLSEIAMVVFKLPIINHIAALSLNASAVYVCFAIAEIVFKYVEGSRFFAFLAKQSFGIYLYHMIPIWIMRYWGVSLGTLWLLVLVTCAVSLVFSIVVTHIVRMCHLQGMIGER